jgi:hypothetical protein
MLGACAGACDGWWVHVCWLVGAGVCGGMPVLMCVWLVSAGVCVCVCVCVCVSDGG